MLQAIVLAAGLGRRMGAPKALLSWGSETMVVAHAREALAAGAAGVLVVVRAQTAGGAIALPAGAVWCVSDEDEALGPAGSIRAAVRALDARTAWVAVCPVHPMAHPRPCAGQSSIRSLRSSAFLPSSVSPEVSPHELAPSRIPVALRRRKPVSLLHSAVRCATRCHEDLERPSASSF
jgi:hypothetical protein